MNEAVAVSLSVSGMASPTAIITGVSSRGGLSNWVLFFRLSDLVAIDVGATPSIIAGVRAGLSGRVGGNYAHGPLPGEDVVDANEWIEALEPKAKRLVVKAYPALKSIAFQRNLMSNELVVKASDGESWTFGFMDREQSEAVHAALQERFHSGYTLVHSGPHAFLSRWAPFLTK